MAESEVVSAEEIQQFQPRVGLTERDRLQWALDFARKDLDALTPGDWSNLRREFVAFAEGQLPPREKPRSSQAEWSNRGLPTEDVLRQVQRHWLGLLTALIKPGRSEAFLRSIPTDFYISRDPARGITHSVMFSRDEPALLRLIWHLERRAHLLAVCPEQVCHRWFVARRRGQRFCSRACQNRAAIRDYRREQGKKKRPQRRLTKPRHGR